MDFLKERPSLLFSSHDLKMESRPEFSHLHLFICNPTSSVLTRFLVAAFISGRDLKMESRPQNGVATWLFLPSVSRPLFQVTTSKASYDLFVTLLTLCLCLNYMYLVATPIISVATFYLHQYQILSCNRKTGSRPQLILLAFLLVATPIFF